MTDTWYFAYGSSLLLDQKTGRTGTIRAARRCRLSGYGFAFNKRMRSGAGVCANIVPAEAKDAPARTRRRPSAAPPLTRVSGASPLRRP